jgi:iron complex outermembrane receptor protein
MLAGAAPAFAQPAPPEPGATLGEIVVTAQRREERSRDVPISITTLGAQQLTQANVQSLGDIVKLTPALRFDTVGAFAQPTIRGVGTALVTSGGGSDVGIYVDGFYVPNPLSADSQLMNVENVQVLKGPQGTLFGRNTTGGAILVTTAKPSADAHGVLEASYGSYDTAKLQGYATTGLTDNVAVDAEGAYRRGDGFVKNIYTGSRKDGEFENWSARFGLKADLSEDLSVLLRYEHQHVDDPTIELTNAPVLDGRPLTPARTIPGAIVATRPGEISTNVPVYFHLKSDAFQGTATWDLHFATLTSYTQYRKEGSHQVIDVDVSSAPNGPALLLNIFDKTFSQEFLLTSHPGPALRWTAGLFYFNYVDDFKDGALSFGGPFARFADSGTTTRSVAGFLDLTYAIRDDLFVTVGGRYSHDEVRDAFYLQADLSGYVHLPTLKKDTFTPRLVVRYKPNENSSVYASVTRGYKAPIYNVGGNTPVPVNSETITAFEAGYKYGSSRLSFDLAGYYYKYRNLQVAAYNGTQSLVNNAGQARIYGADGQVRYALGNGFTLQAGAAYTDAKYTRYKDAPAFILDAATIDAFGFVPNTTVDASGNRMQRAPEFTANLGLTYQTDVAGGRAVLSGNLFHTSSIFFDPAEQFRQGAYDIVALRAEWTDPSDRYTLAVFADNVTNADYLTQYTGGPFGVRTVWGYPRTVGASVRVKM